ncbi:MAG: YggS family pyridoxal phosphate-dependent enzyme [Methylococcales bacterium]
MTTLAERLTHILAQIKQTALAYGRHPDAVTLLAVSKTKPASDIMEAYQAGQRHFGENYLQEALNKQLQLQGLDITWHFIGPIQSNKTKAIAEHFSWVHSVDSLKIATRLSKQRPPELPPLNICIQVNISNEASKSGISLEQLPALYRQVSELPNLKLRGVMAIPEPEHDFERQRQPYRTLYKAVAELPDAELDTFSFGMSGDLEAAIAEGATMVRIGTALFGERDYS